MRLTSYKLSIAIPTYNRASILDRALDNIASQISSENDIQVVISDNGSTDNTHDIVEKYTSRLNIKYAALPENKGFDKNYINAIYESDGEYVWVKGDDDLITPYMIDKAKEIISGGYDVVVLNGGDYKENILTPRVKVEPDVSSVETLFNCLGWHISWIGTIIIKKGILRCDELIDSEFDNFVHMPLYVRSIKEGHALIYSREVFIHTTINNSEYFSSPEKLVSLFGGCLYDSLKRYIDVKISTKTLANIQLGYRCNLDMFDYKYFIMSRILNGYTIRRHIALLHIYVRLNPWAYFWLLTFIVPNSMLVKAYQAYKKLRDLI